MRTFASRRHVGLLILATGLGVVAKAQTVDSLILDRLNRLEQELNEVKSENKELRQELQAVSSNSQAVASTPKATYPNIRVNALGSVEFGADDIKGSPSTAVLGDVDLVTTAKLNENGGATMDYVVASNHGSFAYEIERLFVSYRINDYVNFDVGRFHTAMGWYNNFYHNGVYFQTTRDRPEVYEFEDNAGILPVHSTGISMNGALPSATLGLSYSLELSNGRSYTANEDEALRIEDDNDHKAINVQLRSKPEALADWQFGVGAYHDILSPVLHPETAPDTTTNVDQFIFSAYAVYKSALVEWFTEGAIVGDRPDGGNRHWTFAGYSQVSHKFGAFRPYARYQWHDVAESDPVMILIGRNVSSWGTQLGVRYDFASMMALKLEYEYDKPSGEDSTNSVTGQLAFRF